MVSQLTESDSNSECYCRGRKSKGTDCLETAAALVDGSLCGPQLDCCSLEARQDRATLPAVGGMDVAVCAWTVPH